MRKQISAALLAVSAIALGASGAQAASCEQGLACPGVLPNGSPAQSTFVPTLDSASDLGKVASSGYYAYNSPGGASGIDSQRVVAYVIRPGDWSSAPGEVTTLVDHLLPAEKTTKWVAIFGNGAMMSWPWTTQATAARLVAQSGIKAHAAAASDCVSPWFCVFTDSNFGGNMCQWQSTGVWQTMPSSCNLAASSMVNRRGAWSLLKRTDGRNYCAVPNSQDAALSNNGFNDNTYETYNSTSTTKQSAWNCAN